MKEYIQFTIHHYTNPVPYKRTTQKQKFKDLDYKTYIDWKNTVVIEFINLFKKYPHQILEKNRKYYVDIMVYFKDKKHGDPDNIAKGINDAIFQKPLNDKYIAGSYDFDYDKQDPRVEVIIRED